LNTHKIPPKKNRKYMWNAIKLVSSNLNSEIKLPHGYGGVSDKRMRGA